MPDSHTEDRWCYLCLGMTPTMVTVYRAYVLSECMSCGHVRSNELAAD